MLVPAGSPFPRDHYIAETIDIPAIDPDAVADYEQDRCLQAIRPWRLQTSPGGRHAQHEREVSEEPIEHPPATAPLYEFVPPFQLLALADWMSERTTARA